MVDRIMMIYYHACYMSAKKSCLCHDYCLGIGHELVKYVYEPHFDIDRCLYDLFHIIFTFKSGEPPP